MKKFCSYCGKPLMEGEVCGCRQSQEKQIEGTYEEDMAVLEVDLAKIRKTWNSMKVRMGIENAEINQGDAYEKNKKIIPDCIEKNDGEVPVRQYEIATLQNRILFVPYAKAVGRIQVTNKRVIFRAPGKSFAGRTTLQQEFAVDEIGGIEARREYIFNLWTMLLGVLAALFGGISITALVIKMGQESLSQGSVGIIVFLALLFGIGGCIPFFTVKNKWLMKILCLGASFFSMYNVGKMLANMGHMSGAGFNVILRFLSAFPFIFAVFSICVYAISPNLVLLVKTKGGEAALDIKRKKVNLFGLGTGEEDHTGYSEIMPMDDVEKCIREMNAVINDIQKLGDFGVEKWRSADEEYEYLAFGQKES